MLLAQYMGLTECTPKVLQTFLMQIREIGFTVAGDGINVVVKNFLLAADIHTLEVKLQIM